MPILLARGCVQRCRAGPGGEPVAVSEAGHVADVGQDAGSNDGLAARVRLFDTGHNRKTDAHDAHAVAAVAVRTTTLRVLQLDGELEAERMLTDRREALTRRRVQTVDRLQALLAELLPGQAKRDITTGQAKAMLASVRPRDIAGKTRRRIAAEELAELIAVEAKIKKATAELKSIVLARPAAHLSSSRVSRDCEKSRPLRAIPPLHRALPAVRQTVRLSPSRRTASRRYGRP